MNNELNTKRFPFRTKKFSAKELFDKIIRDRIHLRPVRRKEKWDSTKQSQFIESCLLHIPPQPFYLAEIKDGTYEVVDGLQRLLAICNFMSDLLCLTNVEPELCGKTFKAFDLKFQLDFEAQNFTFYMADRLSDKTLTYIFKNLNGF